MFSTLRSVWVWVATTLLVVFALPVMAAMRLIERDPAHYRTGRIFRWIGAMASRTNPTWHITVEGEGPADPRRPYVVVSNHQSFADIPIISRLPWEMKWVVKAELFKAPLFGWLLRLAGDIPVDRRNKTSRARVLVKARQYLQDRCPVMFFPEGTRSRDGRVLRFTNGAFRLAIKQQVPVLPLAIDGTQEALPKKTWKFDHSVEVRLKVLPPVPTEGLAADDVDELRQQVRGRILEQIAAWRGTSVAAVDSQAEAPPVENVENVENVEDSVKPSPPAT